MILSVRYLWIALSLISEGFFLLALIDLDGATGFFAALGIDTFGINTLFFLALTSALLYSFDFSTTAFALASVKLVPGVRLVFHFPDELLVKYFRAIA